MDLDLADARGGRHRLIGRGWLSYSIWLLTPLALALAVAAVSAMPAAQGTPYAGDAPDPLPSNFLPVPTPAPQPTTTPDPGSATGDPGTGGHPTSAGATPASPDPGLVPAAATSISVFLALSIEAESGQLGSQLKTVSLSGASGGILVSGLGRTLSRTLTLAEVTVPAAGEYHLRLWYTAGTAAGVRIRTGAGTDATVTCPKTEADTIAVYSTTILLTAGYNTITVSGTSNGDASLDRITLW
jgi:hypothetical protein